MTDVWFDFRRENDRCIILKKLSLLTIPVLPKATKLYLIVWILSMFGLDFRINVLF